MNKCVQLKAEVDQAEQVMLGAAKRVEDIMPPLTSTSTNPVDTGSEIVGSGLLKLLPTIPGLGTPGRRTALANVGGVRRVIRSLFQDSNIRKENYDGVATEVAASEKIEQRIHRIKLRVNEIISGKNDGRPSDFDSWQESVKADPRKAAQELINANIMDASQAEAFIANVGKILGRTDSKDMYRRMITGALNTGRSEFPEVVKAANGIRQIIRETGRELLDRGHITQEMFDDSTWLHRKWDVDKIRFHEFKFKQTIRNDVLRRQAKGEYLDRNAADEADELFDKITNGEQAADDPFSARTAVINSHDAQFFLHQDVAVIMDSYAKRAAAAIEFGDLGYSSSLKELKADIQHFYSIEKNGKTEVEQIKIQREANQMMADVETMRSRLVGSELKSSNPMASKLSRALRSVTSLELLPNMTLASMTTDLPNALRVTGLRTVVHSVKHIMSKNFKDITKPDRMRIAASVDHITQAQMDAIAGTEHIVGNDFDGVGTKLVEKTNNFSQKGLAFISQMGNYNGWAKNSISVTLMDKTLHQFDNWAALSKQDRAFYAAHGIGEKEAKLVAEQFSVYGSKTDDFYAANLDTWENKQLAETYSNFLHAVTNDTIATLQPGTLPTWMDAETGKVFGMYTSFIFANRDQLIYAGLQHTDAKFVMAIVGILGLNILRRQLTDEALDRPEEKRQKLETTEDWGLALFEAAMQSGMFGPEGEILSRFNASTQDRFPELLGFDSPERYYGQSGVSPWLGPILGSFGDQIWQFGNKSMDIAAGDTELSGEYVNRGLRFIPGMNNLVVRSILNKYDEQLYGAVGIDFENE